MDDRLDEVYSYLDKHTRVILATVEGTQPRTRVITLIRDGTDFFFATGTGSLKIEQIRDNPAIEFIHTLKDGDNNGYVRGECIAELVDESRLVARLFRENDFMGKLWEGPEDPELTIVRLIPRVFYYLKPGEWAASKILP